MTNIEAYNSMIDGFAVSHKLFSPDEFIYMDENHIIRDEKGNEYETTWDVKVDMDDFKTDWYICKNRSDIDNIISRNRFILNGGPDSIPYIEDSRYQDAIEAEPVDNKFIRSLPLDENGNQLEFSNQDGLYLESSVRSLGCKNSHNCKKYANNGPMACMKCNIKLIKLLARIYIIVEYIALVMLLVLQYTIGVHIVETLVYRIAGIIIVLNWIPASFLIRRYL